MWEAIKKLFSGGAKPLADQIYDFIGDWQDDRQESIITKLNEYFGLSETQAREALIRWAVSDRGWFKENFPDKTTIL